MVRTADDAVEWFRQHTEVDGLGVDTPTAWSGGLAGWRPADHRLCAWYPDVRGSVQSPNGLRGAVAINGIYVIRHLRESWPDLCVTEAHPKVLFYALSDKVYKTVDAECHAELLRRWCGLEDPPQLSKKKGDDHDRDALLAALAARRWREEWKLDLHRLGFGGQRADLLHPAGPTAYAWPPWHARP